MSLSKLSQERGLYFAIASGSTPTGSQAGADLWLREGAAERLWQAAVALQSYNPDYSFWITDAYRPLRLQRHHFELIMAQLAAQGTPPEELYHRTVELIADPDTLPPHSTGGTVDITIYSRKSNAPITMGTVVDSTELPLIHTWCPLTTSEQRHNRMLLCTVLTAAGFKNTPLEWWHYSYGDLEWALHSGLTTTVYDSVEDLDESLIKP
jgi:D-alanyl-D-alanine dipeptidase